MPRPRVIRCALVVSLRVASSVGRPRAHSAGSTRLTRVDAVGLN